MKTQITVKITNSPYKSALNWKTKIEWIDNGTIIRAVQLYNDGTYKVYGQEL